MSSNISRRSLAKGAAWAVPAVAAASVVPAYAASQKSTVSGSVCELFYGSGGLSFQTHRITLGIQSDTAVIPAGTTVSWEITLGRTETTTADQRMAPTAEYSQNGLWTVNISPAPATRNVSLFKVTLTTNSDVPASELNCGVRLIWDASGYQISGGTKVSISTSSSGDQVISAPSTLSYTMAQRGYSSKYANTAHIYTSKSGAQSTYPAIQYSHEAKTNYSNCGATWGNDSSTVYPDGYCNMVKITSGQAVVPAR